MTARPREGVLSDALQPQRHHDECDDAQDRHQAGGAFLAVRTPAGTRALAVITDADEALASTREDIAGARVTVQSDGTANLR